MFNQDPAKPISEQRDIIDQDTQIISILNYYSIKYVVIHWTDLSPEQTAFIKALSGKYFGSTAPLYNTINYTLYEMPEEPIQDFVSLDSGWADPENWSGVPTRWMTDHGRIFIYSENNQTRSFTFQASSFYNSRILTISTQQSSGEKISVPTHFITISVPVILNKGRNILRFDADRCITPVSLTELNNKDPRCLSVAVQNITLT